jgi:hypothetical protein
MICAHKRSNYADFGGYYGFRIGNMKWKSGGQSDTLSKSDTNDDYGVLLGFGYLIPMEENSCIDIGLKSKYCIPWSVDTPGYKASNGLSLTINVGYITYF